MIFTESRKAMKIGYCSDLHTEFLRPDILARRQKGTIGLETFAHMLGEAYADADVVVAAGDIGHGRHAVEFLRQAFRDKPVIYVTGNHDYWSGEIYSIHRKIRETAKDSNINFLQDGESIEIDGVIFCGSTLWTNYKLKSGNNLYHAEGAMNDFSLIQIQDQKSFGAQFKWDMHEANRLMNDFKKIRLRPGSSRGYKREEYPRKLKATDLLNIHDNHVHSIEMNMTIAHAQSKPLVCVTHHAPSVESLFLYDGATRENYEIQPIDTCYASDLEHLMKREDAPKLWIHGHTHISVDYQVGGTRIVSNPKGYSDYSEETGWEIGKFVEI